MIVEASIHKGAALIGGGAMSLGAGMVSKIQLTPDPGLVNVNLTGAEIVGFIMFAIGVVPVVWWLSRLQGFASENKKEIVLLRAELLERAVGIRQEIQEKIGDSRADRAALHSKIDSLQDAIHRIETNCAAVNHGALRHAIEKATAQAKLLTREEGAE